MGDEYSVHFAPSNLVQSRGMRRLQFKLPCRALRAIDHYEIEGIKKKEIISFPRPDRVRKIRTIGGVIKIHLSKRMIRTPKCPIAQHIHDQTRTVPRFRRPSSAARPQKRHFDILGHLMVPPNETVFHVLVVKPVFSVFRPFAEPATGSVGVSRRCGGGVSAGEERRDSFVQSPLPRRLAVPGA